MVMGAPHEEGSGVQWECVCGRVEVREQRPGVIAQRESTQRASCATSVDSGTPL